MALARLTVMVWFVSVVVPGVAFIYIATLDLSIVAVLCLAVMMAATYARSALVSLRIISKRKSG